MTSVELLIKSPNQQVDDLQIPCDLTWSIKRLKDYLHSTYPTKPLPDQQKIIYSGRVLPDHLLLKEVLTQGLDIYTMHLVCPQSTYAYKNDPMLPHHEQMPKPLNDQLPIPDDNVLPTTTATDDGVRLRFWNNHTYPMNMAMYNQGPMPQLQVGNMPVAAPYMAYHLAAMQQTYAQVMAQFLAQSQMNHLNAVNHPLAGVPLTQAVGQGIGDPRANAQADLQAAAVNIHRRRLEGEIIERDLLDSLYIVSRIFILGMILYFYSTPTKVLMVMSLGFLLCLYRAARTASRRARMQLEVVRRAPIALRENLGLGPDDNPEFLAEEEVLTNNPDRNQSEGQENSSQVLTEGFSIFNFVKTFFTSLIPDQPLPLET